MKTITYIDEDGFKRNSLIRDNMPDEQAHLGIPQNPPDLRQLDCLGLLRELNALLLDRGLITLTDVQQKQTLDNAIRSVFGRPILNLYKEKENSSKEKHNGTTS